MHYRQAAKAYRALGDTRQEASAMRGVGIALYQTGEFGEAREVLSDAVIKAQSMDNVAGEAEARCGLGRLEMKAGNPAAAVSHLDAAEQLFRSVGQIYMADGLKNEVAAARRAPLEGR